VKLDESEDALYRSSCRFVVVQTHLRSVSCECSNDQFKIIGRVERKKGSLVCELTPSVISSLLFDQFIEVEISIELIRFGTRIAEDTLLIELLGNLQILASERSLLSKREGRDAYFENSFRSHAK